MFLRDYINDAHIRFFPELMNYYSIKDCVFNLFKLDVCRVFSNEFDLLSCKFATGEGTRIVLFV